MRYAWVTLVTIAAVGAIASKIVQDMPEHNKLLDEIARRDAIIQGHIAAVASLSPEIKMGMARELSAAKTKRCFSTMGAMAIMKDEEGSCEQNHPDTELLQLETGERTAGFTAYGNRYCTSYSSLSRHSTTNVDQCKSHCTGSCNAIAVGSDCVTYVNCVMSSPTTTQSWGFNYWTKTGEPNYQTTKASGETIGPHLDGSGQTAWTSLDSCISTAISNGHNPGTTLRYVQNSGGLCYFYGPGSSSGAAGTENWRIDPKASDPTPEPTPEPTPYNTINFALNRPASQSTTAISGGAQLAVDTNMQTCSMTQFGLSTSGAWWHVDLDGEHTVSTVRITIKERSEDGHQLTPFRIKVDDQYCTQQGGALDWSSPYPGTGDFICSTPLKGTRVTIEAPGAGRILELCEVEVYETHPALPYPGSDQGCYSGNKYPHMHACGNCTGPGPTQCTSCANAVTNALVPWRNNAREGSCRGFLKNESPVNMRMQTVTNGNEITLAKWGIEKFLNVVLPSVQSLIIEHSIFEFSVAGACYMEKMMRCERKDINTTECEVHKSARLVQSGDDGSTCLIINTDCRPTLFAKVEGIIVREGGTSTAPFCYRTGSKQWAYPAHLLPEIANITSVNEVCASVLQLW